MSPRPLRISGKVTGITGLVIQASLSEAYMGEICEIAPRGGGSALRAEVVGFGPHGALLMPLGELRNIGKGCEAIATGESLTAPVGDALLGRRLDGLGDPMDGRPLGDVKRVPVFRSAPHPLHRRRIRTQLPVGVKAIDAMLPCGEGQRVGIFAAAGGGKSTLMGMIARYCPSAVKVIVLVGERGREVTEFIEDNLGDSLKSSVVIAATAEQPAVVRMKAAYIGTTIAEYFRDRGRKVILMVDSVTRFARAQREIGLARGEPPARYGFPPSVFAELPQLFERCGNAVGEGSITGFYTVLVEGDNLDEPVADESRSLLDGHIILSRKVSYHPKIDVLESESRVRSNLTLDAEAKANASALRDFLDYYRKNQQAIEFGFYKGGDQKEIAKVERKKDLANEFLKQPEEVGKVEYAETQIRLRKLLEDWRSIDRAPA
jgi:FliI/YscN family ATPase